MSHRQIVLSINPSYLCNFRCNFCYLSREQLSSKTRLNPSRLFELLSEVSQSYEITHVDLYGGEVALLPAEYLSELLSVLKIFYKGPLSVITNYSVESSLYNRPEVDLTVSWDYFAREQNQEVYDRMLKIEKPFHVLALAADQMLRMTDQNLDDFISKLNALPKLNSFEIKPFSQNHFHRQSARFDEFENFIKRWLLRASNLKPTFINQVKIMDSLSQKYSSWSDNHLYITPTGNFSVLDFDADGNEAFVEMQDLKNYWQWVELEKRRVSTNPFCSKCEFLGSCLSEHLQDVKSMEHSCNGFQGLLRWAQSQKQESSLTSFSTELLSLS